MSLQFKLDVVQVKLVKIAISVQYRLKVKKVYFNKIINLKNKFYYKNTL